MSKKITTPLKIEEIKDLKAGESVFLTGYIYTGRDAAHKRMIESLDKGGNIPIDVENEIIYYVGPTPAKNDQVIGSAGPTTSYRMDSYAPKLLEIGLKGMIGKGDRDNNVVKSIINNKAVYFAAIGGAAAKISKCIISSEVVAYEDLGPEAIRKIYVKDFPLIVAIDMYGNNFYIIGKQNYQNSKKNV